MKNYITLEERKKIKECYKNLQQAIEKYFPRFDPYEVVPESFKFSPIEENVWHDIRVTGCDIKLPQYPIGKFFVDFADPIKKIALEVDGKESHQDKQKDLRRQREIEKRGWTVYRIDGKDTFYNENEEFGSRSEQIIRNIIREHYREPKCFSVVIFT